MVYINERIDVDTAFKKSFKSMSCLGRKPMLASPRLFIGIFFQIYGLGQRLFFFKQIFYFDLPSLTSTLTTTIPLF
jgi:hypothetical protein